MIRWPFFTTSPDPVAPLHDEIVAAARWKPAYRDFGVIDDFEGRFERLALISTLVLRHLKSLPDPAAAHAQALVDRVFSGLDDAVRRVGVSDVAVGRKVKMLAQGFYGRAEAYSAALEAEMPPRETLLRTALARNLMAGRVAPEAVDAGLVAEVFALEAYLRPLNLESLLSGRALGAFYAARSGERS